MYTSILGNKQSTINSYMYIFFFFPFHIQKGLGRHKLSSSTIIKLVQDSNFPPPWIDAPHSWRANREQTPLQSQKEKRKLTKGEPLALLDFHSSNRTNSLFVLFNVERRLKVVTFHIRTSAGRLRLQSAGDIRSNGATLQRHSHHASHQDLEENNTTHTTSSRLACLIVLSDRIQTFTHDLFPRPHRSYTLV